MTTDYKNRRLYNFVIDTLLDLPSIQITIKDLFGDDYVVVDRRSDLTTILIMLGEIKSWEEFLKIYGSSYHINKGLTIIDARLGNNLHPKRIQIYNPAHNQITGHINTFFL